MKSGAQKRKEREKLLLALDAKKSKKITSFTNTIASASTLVQERQEATGKESNSYIINLFYFFVYLLILF